MTSNKPIRVVVVDDHPILRNGLRALFETVEDIEFAGEADSGEAALEVVRETRPDVVVMDVEMPGMGGVEAVRQLCASNPETAFLILTMHGQDAVVEAALRAGARGYLVKGAGQEDILRTIRAVAHGDAVLSSAALGVLRNLGRARSERTLFPELTEREVEVLALVADGLDNVAIGSRLGLTPKTVANNVSSILSKLGLVDRAAVVVHARRAGLGSP